MTLTQMAVAKEKRTYTFSCGELLEASGISVTPDRSLRLSAALDKMQKQSISSVHRH